ncbi:MAG: hypothetical protein Q4G04_04025 [bacterium]|nr:hypothetical protein [bacterium]
MYEEKYKKLKAENKDKIYLFKSGIFYLFLEEDAVKISQVTTLKLGYFGKMKRCGFPIKSLDKYLLIFKNMNLDIVMVEVDKEQAEHLLTKKLKEIDFDNLTPIDAFKKLNELRELV